MEGPIAEVNLFELEGEWNGAIAFIDRDGVLNIGSPNYINSPDELQIIEGSKESIQALRNIGYRIVLVTNQSAIMRGIWGEDTIHSIHKKLQEEIVSTSKPG
jgi:D-glycero-D-manno-heptose 1,7-bisphosphate phosphatase